MEELATQEAWSTTEVQSRDQYLIFQVEKEAFGVPILNVQEIIGYRNVTPIPNTPKFLRGVLNLRGVVAPVVDLRRQFGLDDIEYTRFNVIVIVRALEKIMGIIVDTVRDVKAVSSDQMQPPPTLASRINTEFISGVVSADEEMLIMLDLDRIFTDEQIGILDRVTEEKDNG